MNCHYCHTALTRPTATRHRPDMYTRDHIHPKCLGGVKTVPCCLRCNGLKADMTMRQWDTFRDKHPDWRNMNSGRDVKHSKAADRALIFQQLRIKRIAPVWPIDVWVRQPVLCRGLA